MNADDTTRRLAELEATRTDALASLRAKKAERARVSQNRAKIARLADEKRGEIRSK